ncbi:hypothetical protein MED297_09026 [Reinekea sp. MED297]|uniref:Uncharacterized protein n=1 Tax=Reinekea blandensis MED297 TaxID=314283 RepID=A4BGI9_9GAMM|nr:hypothetical protein MED297_09026 [Reinekea sp. MED297] [Reinekea blandensis MED297]
MTAQRTEPRSKAALGFQRDGVLTVKIHGAQSVKRLAGWHIHAHGG